MQTIITDLLTEAIREQCRKNKSIVAAYLFGSFASEKVRPLSDIDVGIFVEPGFENDFPFLAFASSLEKVCNTRVDLILLNRAGELLKYQVRRYGSLIFERDSRMRKRFEVMGRKLYEDFFYLHSRYVRSVLYGNSSKLNAESSKSQDKYKTHSSKPKIVGSKLKAQS